METGYKPGKQCIYNVQSAEQPKPIKMETKLYQILNERIEEYKNKIEHYNKMCDYSKAAEYSFKVSEVLSIQMLMISLDKEVEGE